MPLTVRKGNLEALRNAFRAQLLSISADEGYIPANPTADASLKAVWKLQSAELAKNAEPYLNKSWMNNRMIESGAQYAKHLKLTVLIPLDHFALPSDF